MKNKILIVANWKMNPGTVLQAKEIFTETKKVAKSLKNVKVIVCPPFVYLNELERLTDRTPVLGAQDMFWERNGSFTGEISSEMLKEESYVILGHSERRELGETDDMIAKKIISAIKANLKPILCIGEKIRDDHGEYLHSLRNQIINSLAGMPKKYLDKLIIAYEPVWAIGKSDDQAMKPSDIHETTLFIKKVLLETYKLKKALLVPVLYGGSVTHNNASEIIAGGQVQGLLVGRESLNPKKFGELLAVVD
jgi:triosephosphate isomerase